MKILFKKKKLTNKILIRIHHIIVYLTSWLTLTVFYVSLRVFIFSYCENQITIVRRSQRSLQREETWMPKISSLDKSDRNVNTVSIKYKIMFFINFVPIYIWYRMCKAKISTFASVYFDLAFSLQCSLLFY